MDVGEGAGVVSINPSQGSRASSNHNKIEVAVLIVVAPRGGFGKHRSRPRINLGERTVAEVLIDLRDRVRVIVWWQSEKHPADEEIKVPVFVVVSPDANSRGVEGDIGEIGTDVDENVVAVVAVYPGRQSLYIPGVAREEQVEVAVVVVISPIRRGGRRQGRRNGRERPSPLIPEELSSAPPRGITSPYQQAV